MILVMCGDSAVRPKVIGASLAVELGWRSVDADEFRFLPLQARPAGAGGHASRPAWLASLHSTMAFALERREPLVVLAPPLTGEQMDVLRGELRPVRFVMLREAPATRTPEGDERGAVQAPFDLALDVDPHTTPEPVCGAIRREFGL